jgi:hypothetical protein
MPLAARADYRSCGRHFRLRALRPYVIETIPPCLEQCPTGQRLCYGRSVPGLIAHQSCNRADHGARSSNHSLSTQRIGVCPVRRGIFVLLMRKMNAVVFPELVAAFTRGPDALGMLTSVPERASTAKYSGLRDQLHGLARIARDPWFWRIGLLAAFTQAAGLALLGLWAGPWIRDIAGLARADIAQHLLVGQLFSQPHELVSGYRVCQYAVPASRTRARCSWPKRAHGRGGAPVSRLLR